jgi:hypothetical protein
MSGSKGWRVKERQEGEKQGARNSEEATTLIIRRG